MDLMVYKFFLSIHIIGFIVWMAGLFYWIRIMVYQSEVAMESSDCRLATLKQLQKMSFRLYRAIIVPGMIITWCMGLLLVYVTESYLFGWFHFKLFLVVLLTLYQFYGKNFMERYQKAIISFSLHKNLNSINLPSSKKMRLYNEFATLLMAGIVFSVILKNFTWIAIAYGGFFFLLICGFTIFFLLRKKKSSSPKVNEN